MPRRLVDLPVETGTPVLVRVDFNVPLADGEVADDTRIRAAIPTIQDLRGRGAKVVLCSHLGRPRGRRNTDLSLEPVAARLAELLDDEVWFAHDTVGEDVEELVSDLPAGGLLMVENLRFNPGETENSSEFAGRLARLGRYYVGDAFGAMHRTATSVVGVVSLMESSAIGLLVEQEITALGRLQAGPQRPFVAVLGGARVSDKVGLIESLAKRCDALIIGGAMALTFLVAQGRKVGRSKVENEKVLLAKRLLERCAERSVSVYLPVDHVVTGQTDADKQPQVAREIGDDLAAGDIGPETIARFHGVIARAGTVFWNGPMGILETPAFEAGTRGIAESIAGVEGYTVVAGADTTAAIGRFDMAGRFSHVSMGAAAALEFIEGRELPGIRALRQRSR